LWPVLAARGVICPAYFYREVRSTLRVSFAECSIIACGQPSYTEPLMANEALINPLEWCKRERENLQCQFDALKAGRFKTHSNDGSGWKDTTQDSIERVEENIRELSKLIYKYEAARFER
jgi:hypothetical protein